MLIPAVQCERKPLALDPKTLQQQLQQQQNGGFFNRNKTIGLDYQTSSDESDEDKSSRGRAGGIRSNENVDEVRTDPIVVDRVDEEGGRALLHLSQSCQRREISINSDDSSSELGTIKSEPSFDEPMNPVIGCQKFTNYPAYTGKPTSCINNHFQPTIDNNNTKNRYSLLTHLHNGHMGGEHGNILLKSADTPELLNCSQHRFDLEAPAISTTDVGYLYEISTRLLFVTIDWIQSLEVFQKLSRVDQCNLLLNKWHSLFVLGMAQSSSMFPVSTLLFLANVNNEKEQNNKESETTTTPLPWSTFVKLKDIILNGGFVVRGEISKSVYNYMKIVTLFDAGMVRIFISVHFFLIVI